MRGPLLGEGGLEAGGFFVPVVEGLEEGGGIGGGQLLVGARGRGSGHQAEQGRAAEPGGEARGHIGVFQIGT